MTTPISSRPSDAALPLLRPAEDLRNQLVRGRDGALGRILDLYFELPDWAVRYALVRGADDGRRMLMSTEALRHPEREEAGFQADLTRSQVEGSPSYAPAQTTSREEELRLRRHFGWRAYWRETEEQSPGAGSNLHSVAALRNFSLHALDGDIGCVADFLVELPGWHLRYFVAATHQRAASPHVVLATAWVAGVDWAAGRMLVEVDRETVRTCPHYGGSMSPDDVRRLHLHYRKGVPGTSAPPPALS